MQDQKTAIQKITPAQQVAPLRSQASQVQGTQKLPEKKQFGRKKSGVIFITRLQLSLYIDGLGNIATLPFTPDVVRDLDVINDELLAEKVASFSAQQQLPPASFIVILSNQTLFSKQVTATDVSQKKVDEEKFINTIPFEDPAVRNITMGSNTYTVVANKQLFVPIGDAFGHIGSEFSSVLPEFLFGKELNLAQGLTVQSAQIIMKRAQEFKAFSFVQKNSIIEERTGEGEVTNSKYTLQVTGGKSNRMFVVSGLLVMVVGVLIAAFLFIQQNNAVPPQNTQILEAPTPLPPSPTMPVLEGQGVQVASESAAPSTPSASVQGDTSSDITIQYTQGSMREAYILTERLRKLGFQTITPQLVLSSGEVTQIGFRPTVSGFVENLIVSEVEKQIGAVTILRTHAITNDVVIFIGNIK